MEKEKTDSQKRQYYKQIAKRSFKSEFDQYLFYRFSRGLQASISVDDFKSFKGEQEIIDEYVNEYWQKNYSFKKEGKWKYSIKEIGNLIYNWEKEKDLKVLSKECETYYVIYRFEKIFPYEQFIKLIEKQTCHYCGISEEKIEELLSKHKISKKKVTRGWTLEIDRKEPNLEYTFTNCVRCCYWCNSAKTDEFNEEEFIPIGDAIRNIWHERLSS